jgi:hypothetical protein
MKWNDMLLRGPSPVDVERVIFLFLGSIRKREMNIEIVGMVFLVAILLCFSLRYQ